MTEYKPIPIREILVNIKDYSELMIDLAYSALIFNDKELAEEVLRLEKEVHKFRDLLNMTVMIAVRDAEDAKAGIGISNVAIAGDKISDAAADIAYLVLRGFRLHKLIREAILVAEECVGKIELNEKSVFANKRIKEVHVKTGIDIIAIRRADKWIINPNEGLVLPPKSILIVRGSKVGIDKLKTLKKK